MGQRRLRDAARRGNLVLAVYDDRADRRSAAAKTFGVTEFAALSEAIAWKPDALVISTPPDNHTRYIQLAHDLQLHYFCEAGIWTAHVRGGTSNARDDLVAAHSCTLHFHPLVKALKRAVSGSLGKLFSFQYVLSTYLPDWHPWEQRQFYAWNRETAAAREMVPFELLWLNEVFGSATQTCGAVLNHQSIDADLEDCWALQMHLTNGAMGQMLVHMGSPSCIRRGTCIGQHGTIEFDLQRGRLVTHCADRDPTTETFGNLRDVIESVYQEEFNTFVEAIFGRTDWPLSLSDAATATATLAASEIGSLTGRVQKVRIDRQPAILPTDYATVISLADHAAGASFAAHGV